MSGGIPVDVNPDPPATPSWGADRSPLAVALAQAVEPLETEVSLETSRPQPIPADVIGWQPSDDDIVPTKASRGLRRRRR